MGSIALGVAVDPRAVRSVDVWYADTDTDTDAWRYGYRRRCSGLGRPAGTWTGRTRAVLGLGIVDAQLPVNMDPCAGRALRIRPV